MPIANSLLPFVLLAVPAIAQDPTEDQLIVQVSRCVALTIGVVDAL